MKEEFRIEGTRLPDGRIGRIHKPTREELLALYAEKSVRGFMQVDAHGLCEEGEVIHTNFLYELRDSYNPVRVQIPEGARRGSTLYHLKLITQMLEEDWYRLDELDGGIRPKPSS